LEEALAAAPGAEEALSPEEAGPAPAALPKREVAAEPPAPELAAGPALAEALTLGAAAGPANEVLPKTEVAAEPSAPELAAQPALAEALTPEAAAGPERTALRPAPELTEGLPEVEAAGGTPEGTASAFPVTAGQAAGGLEADTLDRFVEPAAEAPSPDLAEVVLAQEAATSTPAGVPGLAPEGTLGVEMPVEATADAALVEELVVDETPTAVTSLFPGYVEAPFSSPEQRIFYEEGVSSREGRGGFALVERYVSHGGPPVHSHGTQVPMLGRWRGTFCPSVSSTGICVKPRCAGTVRAPGMQKGWSLLSSEADTAFSPCGNL
jgi:hypothetical protein